MDLSRSLTNRHEICIQVWCKVKADNLLLKIFLPTPVKFGGKTSKLPQILEDRCESEARNFQTAQHVGEQVNGFSSTINVLQNGTKLGAIMDPTEF